VSVQEPVAGIGQLYAITDAGSSGDLLCLCSHESHPSLRDDVVVIGVAGEVDLCGEPLLQAALTGAVADRPSHLAVDLSGVTFCSINGIRFLGAIARETAMYGINFAISGLSPGLRRHTSMLWEHPQPLCYDTVTSAVRGIAARYAS
jgi:anti-anti-sigma factor